MVLQQPITNLQQALLHIDGIIRQAVERASAAEQNPTNVLSGLVVTEEDIQYALEHQPLATAPYHLDPHADLYTWDEDSLLADFTDEFELSVLDANIFLVCLAPQLDRRYERLFSYLQDDVTQRYPTVNLLMNLFGDTVHSRFDVWERLMPDMPLRAYQLVRLTPSTTVPTDNFLHSVCSVDHAVVAALLGRVAVSNNIAHATNDITEHADKQLPSDAEALLETYAQAPMVMLVGREGNGQLALAAGLGAAHNQRTLALDAAKLDTLEAWQVAIREGRLRQTSLLVNRWQDALKRDSFPQVWQLLLRYPRAVFICTPEAWEPTEPNRERVILRHDIQLPDYPLRVALWQASLDRKVGRSHTVDCEQIANKFRLTHDQIANAVSTAIDLAASEQRQVTTEDCYHAAQRHSTVQLGDLAKQVVPRHTWDDLVLPADCKEQLREIAVRLAYDHRVRNEWNYGRRVAPTAGVSALFAGESGTGKTMSAQVIARELGLLMYRIDLSMVVSKYIGETEKNLRSVFEIAQAGNAVLFFDEADALFGKRSEVKDAHDRYANIEIAYLLQQIEDYDGIAILATNLRQNLDDAFTRRLDFLIDFPFPEAEYREELWRRHFPARAPLSADIDFAWIAQRYRLAGGNIRNASLHAAYLAAADGGVITQAHIRSAVRREHQKMGRLVDDPMPHYT